jgi:tRNA-specific 2-thiouridylase
VRCNQFIKFDALLAKAEALGADYVATGHYARTMQLASGRWAKKDQSYVLYVMSQERLARTVFPLGEQTKEQTRAIAEELGLHVAGKVESQEICFVPTKNYRDYLREHDPSASRPGRILNLAGRLVGRHEGVAYYTIGQRRGLGLSSDRPLFVVDIWPDENTLVVGEEADLYRTDAFVEDPCWMAIERLEVPMRVGAKARYKAEEAEAVIEPYGEGQVRVVFDTPQRALTPGQTIVFYDGDVVVGGGTLTAPPDVGDLRKDHALALDVALDPR